MIGINQVTKILKCYLKGGLEELLIDNYQGSKPKLTQEQQHLLTLELKTKIYNTATFDEFCSKLDAFFANLDQYRTELASLLIERLELVPAVWEAPASA